MDIQDLIHHDAPAPGRRRFSNALHLENLHLSVALGGWSTPAGAAAADVFEAERVPPPVTPPGRGPGREPAAPRPPRPPQRRLAGQRAALINARFELGMTGQISSFELNQLRVGRSDADSARREQWVLTHHGPLTAAQWTPHQILLVAQNGAYRSIVELPRTLGTLQDLGLSPQQMVHVAMLPNASIFLPRLRRHRNALVELGLGGQAIVELVSRPRAAEHLDRWLLGPWA
jgi:hypothetical protein